ncbi:MAG: hypothetical protein WCW66_04465 [Patescibacteria group bacterium]|jgi:hypothetical protein
MSSELRAVIIKYTAMQLGTSESKVTSDTVIPDIYCLVRFVSIETERYAKNIKDITAKHTVAEAIALFEE